MSFHFWALSYIFVGLIPKKVGHPGSRLGLEFRVIRVDFGLRVYWLWR